MTGVAAMLPPLIASHLLLAATALAVAMLVALPLGLIAARRPRLAAASLAIAGLIQTVPGLALLALFYPLLLALSALSGLALPAFGFLPALLALSLYAVLPILRTMVAGLRGIDPVLLEAADGIGMTKGQRLWLVEAPLAAPVIMAGIRTAAVWTIGAATLATTVGYPTLGNPIFAGLQTENWPLVLAGCGGAAGLAILVDALLGLVERGLVQQRPAMVRGGAMLLLLGVAVALAPLALPQRRPVVIGAKTFSEQYVLARLIGARLQRAGYPVVYREGLGSAVAFRALSAGDVDVYVDYAGTLWNGVMNRHDRLPAPAMLNEIRRWMTTGSQTALVGPLGFQNAYVLAMRPGASARTIADIAPVAPRLALGADLEFLDRPEWRAIRDAYRLRFRETRAYTPTFMYRALAAKQADVIAAFSSDGRIASDRLVVLSDPKGAIPRYDALLLASPARAHDARFLAVLRPLIGAISINRMRAANDMVDRDANKATPDEAAAMLDRAIRP